MRKKEKTANTASCTLWGENDGGDGGNAHAFDKSICVLYKAWRNFNVDYLCRQNTQSGNPLELLAEVDFAVVR